MARRGVPASCLMFMSFSDRCTPDGRNSGNSWRTSFMRWPTYATEYKDCKAFRDEMNANAASSGSSSVPTQVIGHTTGKLDCVSSIQQSCACARVCACACAFATIAAARSRHASAAFACANSVRRSECYFSAHVFAIVRQYFRLLFP